MYPVNYDLHFRCKRVRRVYSQKKTKGPLQILAMKERVTLDQMDKAPAAAAQKMIMPLRILIPKFLKKFSIPVAKQELLGELLQIPRAFMQG